MDAGVVDRRGGPLGVRQPHGTIRWMLEQFKSRCRCDRRTDPDSRCEPGFSAPLLRQSDTVVYRVKDGGIRDEVRWVTDERANTAQML